MGKSRYSKTKGAGMLCGMSRYKKQFKSREARSGVILNEANNRQTRRMMKCGE